MKPAKHASARCGAGPSVRLRADREKALARRHPWIFSGAIDRVEGDPRPGDTVRVLTAAGAFAAWAAFSPQSQIRARVWSWHEADRIDAAFIAARIAAAVARRGTIDREGGTRLVHAEADELPGIVADRYADTAVVQLSSAGAERWRDAIAASLAALPGIRCVYERSDAEVRALEGLPVRNGPLVGPAPAGPVPFVENGVHYQADVVAGHKTGFYLDQRDNRALVAGHAAGARMLNCFSYTGGFALAALAAGAASVLSIDSSADALAIGRAQATRNGFEAARATWETADVFTALRALRDAGRQFDLVVLDPPKFAPTAGHVERASRAYKDINLLGFKLLAPGGVLATFSCSGAIDAQLFQRIVAGAAQDARTDALIIRRMAAPADHPLRISFPEGEYLKGMLLKRT